jgi:hypothetical protein
LLKNIMSLLNPELNIGDRVVIMDMSDESGITPGMGGTVNRMVKVFGTIQYEVKWDNGSNLQILSDVDKWMKEEDWQRLKNRRKKVDESMDPDFARKKKNLVQDFEMAKMHKFYEALRKSSVVNMITGGATSYFWMGKDRIAHQHFYDEMNDDRAEAFEKVLDSADEIKNILISGALKTLEREGKEVTLDAVKRVAEKKVRQIVSFIQQVY